MDTFSFHIEDGCFLLKDSDDLPVNLPQLYNDVAFGTLGDRAFYKFCIPSALLPQGLVISKLIAYCDITKIPATEKLMSIGLDVHTANQNVQGGSEMDYSETHKLIQKNLSKSSGEPLKLYNGTYDGI